MIYFPIYSKSAFELSMSIFFCWWTSLIDQLVKIPAAMQETLVQFLGQEDLLERDRLPTPIFLGFPCGSAGKESACNAGHLDSTPGLGRSPGEGTAIHSSILAWKIPWTVWPWGHKESDMTEQLWFGKGMLVYLQDTRGRELLMIRAPLSALCSSLVTQLVKILPAVQVTQVWFLGRKAPLEKEMAIHSSILAWEIPRTEEPGGLQPDVT